MAEDVVKLIEKVREYVFLYDISHPDYKNLVRKAAAWREISEELGQTSETSKQKWKNLRDSYIKYKRFNGGMSGKATRKQLKAAKKYKNWPWSQHLKFLDDPYAPRPTTYDYLETPLKVTISSPPSPYPESSCPQSPEQFEIPPPSTKIPKKTQSVKEVNRVIEYLKNKNKNKYQLDGTDHLFISYAKTFKKLPPRTQAMLKIELATLFARAEISALDAQTTPTSSTNSVGSGLNSDESKYATEHYGADVLRLSSKDLPDEHIPTC